MEESIGHKIKCYRVKANMNQDQLARGIISVSYLSKIENGHVKPTPEITKLLFKKLGINSKSTERVKTMEVLHTWFEHLFRKDRDKARDLYEAHIKNNELIITPKWLNLLEIHKLRYFLLINDKHDALKQLKLLEKLSGKFDQEKESYYWYKYQADYYYESLFYEKAFELYLKAEQYLDRINISQEEKYELIDAISIIASKLNKIHLALLYALRSLYFYQKNYKYRKCADCHILIGISYRRISDFKKAMEHYQYALSIANTLNDINISKLCYQNMGKLYSLKGNYKEAISNFEASYQLRKNDSNEKQLVPVSSLMKEYYQKGDITSARYWWEKGSYLCLSLDKTDSIYIYEFQLYAYLIENNFNKDFESLIIKEILPFLEKKQLYREQKNYLEILANHFFESKKYKMAAIYYRKISDL